MAIDFNELDDDGADEQPPELKALPLGDLLQIARDADDDLLKYEIDLTDLGLNLRDKVDGIVEYLDHCAVKSKSFQARANAFELKARGYRERYRALRQYVSNVMALDADLRRAETGMTEDSPRLGGHAFEFILGYSEAVEPVIAPDPMIFMKLGKKFIRRSYEWDKNALKKELQNNNELISAYAALKRSPKFTINPKG